MTRKPGVITTALVRMTPGTDPEQLERSIERAQPEVAVIRNQSQYSEVDQGFQMIDAMNLAISLLAVGIGAIGVMNTMVMSVFERTREIGVLRAVGWDGGRILRMVVGESLILCVIAMFVGSLLGVLATRAVLLSKTVSSFLEPEYTAAVFGKALLVAIVVALAGAAYPTYRAIRLTPMEALRHE